MSLTKYLKELWKRPKANLGDIYRARLIKWRQEPVLVKVGKPLRLDRAKALGYKAKQGYFIVRVRLLRGGRTRPQIKKGRKTKHRGGRKIVGKNYQWIGEEKVQRKYHNCEVLGSYYVGEDGRYFWYEVILADRELVSKYPKMKWLKNPANKKRVFRGRTSAGRKSRGLRHKGKGTEKIRPSLRANERRGKN